MGSFEEGISSNKKRHRDQIAFDDVQADSQVSASKRTCTATTFPQTNHLCLLEDICTVEDELVEDDVDSAQEELISQMMKNLEKVIAAAGEESSFSQQGQREIDHSETLEAASPLDRPELLRLLSDEEQKDGRDSTESEVDIKYLFEASDDELGIPPSPNSGGEKLFSFTEDVSWLDASNTELNDGEDLQSLTNTCDENWRYILALE